MECMTMTAEYAAWMKLEGKKPRTVSERLIRIKRLFEYCAEIGGEPETMTAKKAQEFQGWLSGSGSRTGAKYAAGTILNYLEAATSFFEFLKTMKRVPSNPFTGMTRIRPEARLPRHVPKENEMDALLRRLKDFDAERGLFAQERAYRAHVVAELLYSTGMRINEAASLTLADIDFESGIVRISETKEGKPRSAFLNDYARGLLFLYARRMRKHLVSRRGLTDRLFGTGKAQLMSLVNRELKRACAAAGLPLITSHTFRHAVGFHLLRAGCNIRHIQALLGHAKLKTTEVYTKIDKDDLKNVIDACHPRSLAGKDRA